MTCITYYFNLLYMSVITLTGGSTYEPDPNIATYSFKCDDFQKHAFCSIDNGYNVLATVNTGSGKTAVGKYAIMRTIKKLCKKVIYSSPVKSLSNEKCSEFKKEYGDVGLLTGDNKIDVEANCLVMTPEIFCNALYGLNNATPNDLPNNFVQSVGCIIFDEFHFMGDADRGHILEEIIILLDPSVQIIMLSATIGNPEMIAHWLAKIKNKTVAWIPATYRIVPLYHHIFVDNKLYKLIDSNGQYDSSNFYEGLKEYNNIKKLKLLKDKQYIKINPLIQMVSYLKNNDLLTSIFFVFSKDKCEQYAKTIQDSKILQDPEREILIRNRFDQLMAPYVKNYEYRPQYHEIKSSLMSGVAYHHASILPILKEVIEHLIKEGLVKLLFATETFALGVNAPVRSVIITEFNKPTMTDRKRLITTSEFLQMAGRAGRRGLDKEGHVIVLPLYEYPDEMDYKTIALGSVPSIKSNIVWNYHFMLKLIQLTDDTNGFFAKSFDNTYREEQIIQTKSKIQELDNQNEDISGRLKEIEPVLIEYTTKLNANNSSCGNIKITPTKQQQAEILKMKTYVNGHQDKNLSNQLIVQHKTCMVNKNKCIEELDVLENCVTSNFNMIRDILIEWEYINDMKPTKKGIVASLINDCNPILLTEMIMEGYLDNLTTEECVGMMSIFTDPIKTNTKKPYKGTRNICENIYLLEGLIENSCNTENRILKHALTPISTDWTISYDYIDISLGWAQGMSNGDVLGMLNMMNEYEGNFLKNMTKISNICKNVMSICVIIGKIELLPILEQVDKKIMRDMVSINSIYLGV